MTTLALIGGDRRQHTLAKVLTEAGYHVTTRALGNTADTETPLSAARAAILPLPHMRGGLLYAPLCGAPTPLAPLLYALPADALLFSGGADSTLRAVAGTRRIVSYADSEPLAVVGAVATAEGAIALAMEMLPCTLWRTPVAVLGYGRIGKLLAARLAALGANVTVFARRPEARTWASAAGHTARPFDCPEFLQGARVIFNTAPAAVLSTDAIGYLARGTLYIELASTTGIDTTAAGRAGVRVELAPGLPGKCAPETAGKALADVLLPLLYDADILP